MLALPEIFNDLKRTLNSYLGRSIRFIRSNEHIAIAQHVKKLLEHDDLSENEKFLQALFCSAHVVNQSKEEEK